MALSAKDLKKIIGWMVKEELEKQLPRMVESVLTEKYIKKVVTEAAAASGKKVSRTRSDVEEDEMMPADHTYNEDEEPPKVLRNVNNGIYNENPLNKESNGSVASLLLSKDNPMAYLYENTKPLQSEGPAVHSMPEMGDAGIPVDEIPGFADRMQKIMGRLNQGSNGGPMKNNEEARIRRERERLDKMKG